MNASGARHPSPRDDAPDRPLLLGMDIGTSRTKALLLGRDGDEVSTAVVPTPWVRGVEITVERLQAALGSLLAGLGEARRRVVSVGVAGIAESGAPLGPSGRPIAPVIAWHDPRGREVVDRVSAHFGDDLPRWIGQPLRTVSSVAKLGWLVDRGIADISCWLGVPELCLHRLTGSRATEFSLAARTGCYHLGERHWLPEVAQAAGIGSGVFPAVEPAGAVMGRVSASGASWSGLPAGIPVTLAGHDHLVGMLGSGARRHDLVNSVGTAESVVACAERRPEVDLALTARVALSVMPGGDGWALLAGAARSGIIVTALAERLGCPPGQLDVRARDAGTVDAAELLDAMARGDVIPLPDAPPGAIWNGMLQALSHRTWEAAAHIAELTAPPDGPDGPRLVVFGGGSRSRPWLWAKQGVGWLPVWRTTAVEAVARGAALHAGVAAGWWASTDTAPRAALANIHLE